MTLSDDLAGCIEKTIRSLAADMYRVARLQDMQLLDNLEHDVGNFTYAIPALAIDAANIDIGEVVV